MSDEEIKILKILINNKDVFYYEDDFNNRIRPLVGKLLDLYTKEKSKNEILEETNKTLYNLCQARAMQEFINNECDYIHKEKIKDKIRMYEAVDNSVGARVLKLLLEDENAGNNEV